MNISNIEDRQTAIDLGFRWAVVVVKDNYYHDVGTVEALFISISDARVTLNRLNGIYGVDTFQKFNLQSVEERNLDE